MPTTREPLTHDLHIRLTEAEYHALEAAAKMNERTRPAEARIAIRAHLALDQRKR